MPDITNADVTAFVNNVIRPLCDRFVGAKATIDSETVYYTNEIAPQIAGNADTDPILDGSEIDGRVTITKADLQAIAGAMAAVNTAIGAQIGAITKAKVNVIMV